MEIFLALTKREKEILDRIEDDLIITYNALYEKANNGDADGRSLSNITFNYWIPEIKAKYKLKTSTRLLRQASTQLAIDYKRFFSRKTKEAHPRHVKTLPIIIQIKNYDPNSKNLPENYSRQDDFRCYADKPDKWGVRVQAVNIKNGFFEVKFPKEEQAIRILPTTLGKLFTDYDDEYQKPDANRFGLIFGNDFLMSALITNTKYLYLIRDKNGHWKVHIPIPSKHLFSFIKSMVEWHFGYLGGIRFRRYLHRNHIYNDEYDFNTHIAYLLQKFNNEIAYARMFSRVATHKGFYLQTSININRLTRDSFIPFALRINAIYIPMSFYNTLKFNKLKHYLLYDYIKVLPDKKFTKLFGGYFERAMQGAFDLAYGEVKRSFKYKNGKLQLTPEALKPKFAFFEWGNGKELNTEQKKAEIEYQIAGKFGAPSDSLPPYLDSPSYPLPAYEYAIKKGAISFVSLDNDKVKIDYPDKIEIINYDETFMFYFNNDMIFSIYGLDIPNKMTARELKSKIHSNIRDNGTLYSSELFRPALFMKDYLQRVLRGIAHDFTIDKGSVFNDPPKYDLTPLPELPERDKTRFELMNQIDDIKRQLDYFNNKYHYYVYLYKQGVKIKDGILNEISTKQRELRKQRDKIAKILNYIHSIEISTEEAPPVPLEGENIEQMQTKESEQEQVIEDKDFIEALHPEKHIDSKYRAMMDREMELIREGKNPEEAQL